MVFDPHRPHMLRYGDPKVRYEQDGRLFDWNCVEVPPEQGSVEPVNAPPHVLSHSEKMKAAWARRKANA